MEIEWRDIDGYQGVYQVSNTGLVRRLQTTRINRNQHRCWVQTYPERIFKPSEDSRGYIQVVLILKGNKRTARVHRLVAECFLKPPSESLVSECAKEGLPYVLVNHINSNKLDNRVENLEWCSSAYNNLHAVKEGRASRKRGNDHYNSKLGEEDILSIYRLSKNGTLSQTKIAELFGVKQITVSNIKTGKSWAWLTGENNTRSRYNKLNSCLPESIRT